MSEPTDLVELLRKIGIRASREAIEAWLVHAAKTKASPAQITEQLCTLEQREREVRNLARRAKIAALGTPKALDRFDWNHPRAIDRELFDQLHSSLDFIRRGENVLLRGQAGVGKTTLAQTLGLRALERGYTVRFCTLPAALADLLKQESIPATERRLRRYVTVCGRTSEPPLTPARSYRSGVAAGDQRCGSSASMSDAECEETRTSTSRRYSNGLTPCASHVATSV